MKIVYKIYIICKINNTFFLRYCLLDLLVGVVQPSVLWKVATLLLDDLISTMFPVTYLEFGSGGGVWPMGGSPGVVGEVHVM